MVERCPGNADTATEQMIDTGDGPSDENLYLFDSLSSPDSNCCYQQEPEPADDDPDKSFKPDNPGGFRTYNVDLGSDSDSEDDSRCNSLNAAAVEHSPSSDVLPSPPLGASSAQRTLGPPAAMRSSSKALSEPTGPLNRSSRGGIGKGGVSALSSGAAATSDDSASVTSQTAGIGRSVMLPGAGLTAKLAEGPAGSGLAELDLTVEIPPLKPSPVAYMTAPSGLTLQELCKNGSSGWVGCTLRLAGDTISCAPPNILRLSGSKTAVPNFPFKLTKRKRCFSNRMGIWSLAEAGQRTLTHHLEGGGMNLTLGKIEIRPGSYWMISSSHTRLQDLVIKGGCVVIHGPKADVMMVDVTIEDCPIVVTGGAKLTMHRCAYTASDVALFATGQGTVVDMKGGSIKSCRQGVCAADGAAVSIAGIKITHNTITCVEARGMGTTLHLHRCLVGETKVGRAKDWDTRAVFVHSVAKATLSECVLWRATFGVWVEGLGSHIDVSDCRIRNNARCAVLAAGGCSVALAHTAAVGSKEFHGVEVGDEKTHAELTACVLQRNKRCGLVAYEGATVVATGCTAEGNGAAAFRARDHARVRIDDCSSLNDTVALAVFGVSAHAEASACVFEGSNNAGVRVGAGGQATVTRCEISGVRDGDGVSVGDHGSRVRLLGCSVSHCKKFGVFAHSGGRAEAADCVASDNKQRAFCTGPGGQVKAVRCKGGEDPADSKVATGAPERAPVTAVAEA